MDIKTIVKTAGFALQKASPKIMLATGVVGMIGTCVMASKATLKVDTILDESKKKVDTIHMIAEDEEWRKANPEVAEKYTEKDKDKDLIIVYAKTALELVKLYGPAILVGGASLALIICSHCILQGRLLAAGAGLAALGQTFNMYKNEVRERYGEEVERDISLGMHDEKFETVHIDESGKEKKTKIVTKVVSEDKIASPFTLIFDERNPNYCKGDPRTSVENIISTDAFLTEKLQRQGFVFWNEIRSSYGYKPVPLGQTFGNIYDPKDPNRCCNVDSGIRKDNPEVRDFLAGRTKQLVLNFRIDGDILDDFYMFDKTHKVSTIEVTEF